MFAMTWGILWNLNEIIKQKKKVNFTLTWKEVEYISFSLEFYNVIFDKLLFYDLAFLRLCLSQPTQNPLSWILLHSVRCFLPPQFFGVVISIDLATSAFLRLCLSQPTQNPLTKCFECVFNVLVEHFFERFVFCLDWFLFSIKLF